MKLQSLRQIQSIRVVQNTTKRRPDIMTVKVGGKIVCQGQPPYVKRVLKSRFNVEIA